MGIQWEKSLYTPFLDTISGEYYSIISDQELKCELFGLARRAIAAFRFPKVSLKYEATYKKVTFDAQGEIEKEEIVTVNDDWNDVDAWFVSDKVTYDEIEIIIAWMKVYWAENQISNADNFLETYTDSNIKTFSRANAIEKNLKFYNTFRQDARELELSYSRVAANGDPSMGFDQ